MVVIRLRSSDEAKEMLKRVKKMSKYADELKEVLEDCLYEEEYEDDDDADFREEEIVEPIKHRKGGRRRYRKM